MKGFILIGVSKRKSNATSGNSTVRVKFNKFGGQKSGSNERTEAAFSVDLSSP